MEEKNMRELSMDEMDKVSGGADYINVNVLYDRVKQAGLMPELAGMDLKSATIKIQEFCQANGLTFEGNKAVAVYYAACAEN